MSNAKTEKRPTRRPLHERGPQKIVGDRDPNFEYRFVNDSGGRLQILQEAGYELVKDDSISVGDGRITASDLGSVKGVISNDGSKAYLMRIKKEFYEEDQKAKQDRINEQENAMKKEASSGMYGSIKNS